MVLFDTGRYKATQLSLEWKLSRLQDKPKFSRYPKAICAKFKADHNYPYATVKVTSSLHLPPDIYLN